MTATERLTTLEAVKEWLGITTDGSDAQLIRVIDAASQFALNYMGRDSLKSSTYTQNFKGNGKSSMLLRNWPVTSVSSVGIAGSLVTASQLGQGGLPGQGFTISDNRAAPQSVDLYGYSFWYNAPCQIIYTAGFETTQSGVIATPSAPETTTTVTPQNSGQWTGDQGVAIDGVAAMLVDTITSAGQYAVDAWGTYTFSGDDATRAYLISYDFVPWDVAFGATQTIGEWWKRKERIGVLSKVLGGQESITFTMQDLNDAVRSMFQPYRNVVPV